jgi:hypothetical protein
VVRFIRCDSSIELSSSVIEANDGYFYPWVENSEAIFCLSRDIASLFLIELAMNIEIFSAVICTATTTSNNWDSARSISTPLVFAWLSSYITMLAVFLVICPLDFLHRRSCTSAWIIFRTLATCSLQTQISWSHHRAKGRNIGSKPRSIWTAIIPWMT